MLRDLCQPKAVEGRRRSRKPSEGNAGYGSGRGAKKSCCYTTRLLQNESVVLELCCVDLVGIPGNMGRLADGPAFFDRQEIMPRARDLLKSGNLLLLGPRRIGKISPRSNERGRGGERLRYAVPLGAGCRRRGGLYQAAGPRVGGLAGHHRKSQARFACVSRFHRRIGSEDVGLEGDSADDPGRLSSLASSWKGDGGSPEHLWNTVLQHGNGPRFRSLRLWRL